MITDDLNISNILITCACGTKIFTSYRWDFDGFTCECECGWSCTGHSVKNLIYNWNNKIDMEKKF